ncbi:tyrosine-type recombinase/integrase [Desulfovibrio oxamicus]|uniref:Tyrosine-type recombinase/integrase n=1 Tax=Nitratidesulfovibrio oxamicus TaxID=32016 RepID=A0ABS0IZD3_9BACT|nr:site-specific integrase [Nitratidesulfovibrio oxamicus]MBG3875553.1 tyrosine-type recombinase/integrase [Nitratidesulfovibrio oxamicus]
MGNQTDDDDDKKDGRVWRTVPGMKGVVYREHPTRRHGKKLDRFLALRYRRGGGQRTIETLGWTSEGWTTRVAASLLAKLKENIRTGTGPQTMKDMRAQGEADRQKAARMARRAALKEITFGELATLYKAWAAGNRVSGPHVAQLLDMHILPELGALRADAITPQHIEDMRQKVAAKRPLRGRGKNNPDARLAPQTVMHVLKTVREVYNYALETPAPNNPGVMLFEGPNPGVIRRRGRGVRPPKHDSRRLRVLNDEEIGALLDYSGTHDIEVATLLEMILLSLDTGPRAGELVALQRQAVDPVKGTLRILFGSRSERSTKGGRTRVVPVGLLFPQALDMLRQRLSQPSDNPYLFPGRYGVGMRDPNGLNRAMRRITNALGLNADAHDPRNRVVWHTLRHTYATRMLEAGADIYTLRDLMGHDSVTTTEGYLHLCDRSKRERALARITLAKGHAGITAGEQQ